MSHHIDGNDPPYIFKGCDQQGHYPQAAEAATEVGAELEPPDHDMVAVVATDVAIAVTILVLIHALVLWMIYG